MALFIFCFRSYDLSTNNTSVYHIDTAVLGCQTEFSQIMFRRRVIRLAKAHIRHDIIVVLCTA